VYDPTQDGSAEDRANGFRSLADIDRVSPALRAPATRTEAQAIADRADDDVILLILEKIGLATLAAQTASDDNRELSERGRLACQDTIDTLAGLRRRLVLGRPPL
jgi:phosphohistidine phosphatase SixA